VEFVEFVASAWAAQVQRRGQRGLLLTVGT
jgi:hypothetical protein